MQYSKLIREIRRAFEHKGGLKILELGTIDADWFSQIQQECAHIIEHAGSSDVGMPKHVTNWTRPSGTVRQFSLFNTSGNSADTTGDYGYLGDASKKKLVFPEMKGLARFAELFRPALRNLRLNGIGINSGLNAHEEQSISATRFAVTYIVRFHLPIFTNSSAKIYVDDEITHFDEGRLYYFNHGCVHAASNEGPDPRYHLVLDAFLEKSLFHRLFDESKSPDPGFIKRTAAPPTEYYHFPNFKRQDEVLMEGSINYGRRAPTTLDWYRTRYPSVFGQPVPRN
jgi:hypothetical protein